MTQEPKITDRTIIKSSLPSPYAENMVIFSKAHPYFGIKVHPKEVDEDANVTKVEFHFRNVSKPAAVQKLFHFTIAWGQRFFGEDKKEQDNG